jgi:hypothetical protein
MLRQEHVARRQLDLDQHARRAASHWRAALCTGAAQAGAMQDELKDFWRKVSAAAHDRLWPPHVDPTRVRQPAAAFIANTRPNRAGATGSAPDGPGQAQ